MPKNSVSVLLVEPEPGLLIETTEQYLELESLLDSKALGLNFDVGHAYCMSERLSDQVVNMSNRTRHYHFEDIAASRVHHHLVPGTGAIEFGPVFEAIGATGYDGWATVELYPFVDDPDAAAREAHRVLRPLVNSAGSRR